jgi:hypothetical protein
LEELPPKLWHNVLLIKEKEAAGTTYEDGGMLARYAKLLPGTNGFNTFVDRAIAQGLGGTA